jgi:hypothetical protein
MKNLSVVLRQLFIIGMITGSMAFFSSCDSCSREGSNSQGTQDGNTANGQTDGTQKPGDNQNSGSTEGTNSSSGTRSDR